MTTGPCLLFVCVFTYLTVPGLNWGMQTFSCGIWDLTDQGLNLDPLCWEFGMLVLAAGPLGEILSFTFYFVIDLGNNFTLEHKIPPHPF